MEQEPRHTNNRPSQNRAVEELEDGELQTAVRSLQNDVGRKRTELSATSATIRDAQTSVNQQTQERQKLAVRLLQVEEVTPLLAETRLVKTELERKWQHLQQLQARTSQEQSNLDEAKRQLEALGERREEGSRLDENLTSVRELEGVHRNTTNECIKAQKRLERAQEELQIHSKVSEPVAPSLDHHVDSLIRQCCGKAGLRLSGSRFTS